ncbi:MAG TPA: hypothetical protein VHM25_10520 [Polyangiaceae bacterium]|jgi:hypothetical protein|nr:hypothetical protein [Polyangiaceae bacterium]
MLGVRRFWCASATLLAPFAFSVPASGNDQPATVSVTTNASDARMMRALVLIRGELSAVGLELQVHGADDVASADTSSDRLSLDVKDGAIVVRVFPAFAQAPLVESVDLDGPEVSAEVIAVRAVEALRAARLLPAPGQRPAPPKATPPPPAASPPVKHAPPEHERDSAAPTQRAVPLLELALGPTFVQNLQGPPQLNGHAALAVGPSWGFVALGAEGSLTGLDFERRPGSAQISRRTLFLQLGARVQLHRSWELNTRAGLHYLHYRASGSAETGYSAQVLEHDTGGVSLSVAGAYYFARAVGVYLDLGTLAAFDAARVRLADETVVTLDRPSFAIGCGVLLGAL